MSVCTFLAADCPLPSVKPSREYPTVINIDDGTIYDGGADDNFFLHPFPDVQTYTDKHFGVQLEWRYTPGRVERIINYIKEALQVSDVVELWHIWLLGWWEYEDRPVIHSRILSISDLTPDIIRDLDEAPVWNTPDKQNPERPSFYRIIITP